MRKKEEHLAIEHMLIEIAIFEMEERRRLEENLTFRGLLKGIGSTFLDIGNTFLGKE